MKNGREKSEKIIDKVINQEIDMVYRNGDCRLRGGLEREKYDVTAIEATSVQVKTMADDTLRLTVDIAPQYAQEAFMLFGMRGAPIVIARLTPEATQEQARKEMIEEDKKVGPLARLAGRWCKMPEFWEWANKFALPTRLNPIASEHDAAVWVRGMCGVASRAEIDCNEVAAQKFHKYIREPFSKVCFADDIMKMKFK